MPPSCDEILQRQESCLATDESIRISRQIDQHQPWLRNGERVAEFWRQQQRIERGIKE